MDHDGRANLDVNPTSGCQNPGNLLGTVGKAASKLFVIPLGLLTLEHVVVLLLELLQVSNGQLKYVSFLQTMAFGFLHFFTISLHPGHQDFFQLVKASVDSCTSLTLK
jgi:hypothetical protein